MLLSMKKSQDKHLSVATAKQKVFQTAPLRTCSPTAERVQGNASQRTAVPIEELFLPSHLKASNHKHQYHVVLYSITNTISNKNYRIVNTLAIKLLA